MDPKKPNPLVLSPKTLEEKLKSRPISKDPRKQKLLNELLDQPDVVEALGQWVKDARKGAQSQLKDGVKGFRDFQPIKFPKTTGQWKKSDKPLQTQNVMHSQAEAVKAKLQAMIQKLPEWMEKLRSSDERHRFALKYFGAIYAQGLWLESVEGGAWKLRGFSAQDPKLRAIDAEALGASAFSVEAMESLKVISAPKESFEVIFKNHYPVHFFAIEKPSMEKRSIFCFFGLNQFRDIERFVIRSSVFEFQKPYQ